MKRLGRWLLNALTVLSLLLCAATVALWVRSGTVGDLWTFGGRRDTYWLRSDWGRLVACRTGGAAASPGWDRGSGGYHGVLPGPARWRRDLGIGWVAPGSAVAGRRMGPTLTVLGSGTYWAVGCYHPVAATLFGWPILVWASKRLRQSRARLRRAAGAGFCPACRYDLTGNVSGVCPECGSPILMETVPETPARSAG